MRTGPGTSRRRGHHRQHGVLRAADLDLPAQRQAALDQDLVHRHDSRSPKPSAASCGRHPPSECTEPAAYQTPPGSSSTPRWRLRSDPATGSGSGALRSPEKSPAAGSNLRRKGMARWADVRDHGGLALGAGGPIESPATSRASAASPALEREVRSDRRRLFEHGANSQPGPAGVDRPARPAAAPPGRGGSSRCRAARAPQVRAAPRRLASPRSRRRAERRER